MADRYPSGRARIVLRTAAPGGAPDNEPADATKMTQQAGASGPTTSRRPAIELYYDLSYRVANGLSPAVVLLAAVMLLVFAARADRPDLAAGYRWGAVVIAVIVIPWTLAWWLALRRPALKATADGLLLRNGRVLEWGLFSKAIIATIDGEEWMGFRFRSGAAKSLDGESRAILEGQDGWCMARLACAFPTGSITTERTQALDRLTSLSGLPVIRNARQIRYTSRVTAGTIVGWLLAAAFLAFAIWELMP